MVASAVMDMFRAIDAMDAVRLSGTDTDGWYIEEAKRAMEDGRILYAGKYSMPDYERILSEGCPVSYTHLDVYKRQVLSIIVRLRSFINISVRKCSYIY